MVRPHKYLSDSRVKALVKELVPSIVQSTVSQISQKTAIQAANDTLGAIGELSEHVAKTIELNIARWVEQKTNNFIVPDGTKFFCENHKGKYTLIVEQKPQVRTVSFSERFVEENCIDSSKTAYRLSFPYVVFIFTVTYHNEVVLLQVAYRTKPLQSLNDDLYFANLPNIMDSGTMHVCMGAGFPPTGDSLCEVVNKTIAEFWARPFNTDAVYAFQKYTPKGLTLKKWERKTAKNSLFVLGDIWHNTERALRDYVDLNVGERDFLTQQAVAFYSDKIQSQVMQCFDGLESTRINEKAIIEGHVLDVLRAIIPQMHDDVRAVMQQRYDQALDSEKDLLKSAREAAEVEQKRYEKATRAAEAKRLEYEKLLASCAQDPPPNEEKKELYGADLYGYDAFRYVLKKKYYDY